MSLLYLQLTTHFLNDFNIHIYKIILLLNITRNKFLIFIRLRQLLLNQPHLTKIILTPLPRQFPFRTTTLLYILLLINLQTHSSYILIYLLDTHPFTLYQLTQLTYDNLTCFTRCSNSSRSSFTACCFSWITSNILSYSSLITFLDSPTSFPIDLFSRIRFYIDLL